MGLNFSSRIFYSMAASSTFNMIIIFITVLADTLIAGHFFGENGINAVNLVTPILSFTTFVSIMNSIGSSIMYSKEMGKFNRERAGEFFSQGLLVSAVSGIILFLLVFFGENLYFRLLYVPEELLSQAKMYYRAYPLIVLITPLGNFLDDMIYADGDKVISNLTGTVFIIGTIAFSVLFCKYWGMIGIGFGSFAAYVAKLPIELIHFRRKKNSFRFRLFFSPKHSVEIMKYGIVDAEEYLCLAVMLYIFNAFVSTVFGAIYITIVTIVVNMLEMVLIFDGAGEAITSIVSIYLAEKNNISVRAVMESAKKFTITEAVIVTIAVMVFAPWVSKSYSVNIDGIYPECMFAIRVVAAAFVFIALESLYSSYYVIKNQIPAALVMHLIYGLLAPVFLGILLSLLIGLGGLWIGIVLSPIIAILMPRIWLARKYPKLEVPLLLDPQDDIDMYDFNIVLTDTSIVELRNRVARCLRKNEIQDNRIFRIKLTLEEYCILVHKINRGKKVFLQCTVYIGENIKIILRDTGKIFDLTDPDEEIDEISTDVVKALMKEMNYKQNLTTIGANRNILCFK